MTGIRSIDTYPRAIQFLYDLRLFGAKFGLDNTRRLAALAGQPHERLRFIHVAGTNGKGSTCAMLESIYHASGLRVGLFTSPHLVSFAERIQVNRRPIAEADVVRLVGEMRALAEKMGEPVKSGAPPPRPCSSSSSSNPAQAEDENEERGRGSDPAHPTFFEVVTVMALRYFAEQRCDLVIWETGLGGRLDSTNIVTPLASVITNIQYDHQRWLGETLARIASEKAGILKPGVPVITAAGEPEALAVIQETALQQRSPLTLVTPEHTGHPPLDALRLPLLGWHQRMNAAVALATVRVLNSRATGGDAQAPRVSDAAIRRGLRAVQWPGRLQLVERPSGQRILLDGAHNSGGMTTLRAALEEHFPNSRPTIILGIMQDKDWELMCEILAPLAARVLCSPVGSERSADPERLREACRRTNPEVEVTVCASLSEAIGRAENDPFVVIAGSLYLIGEAMEALNLTAVPSCDEMGLNEWNRSESQLPPGLRNRRRASG